MTPIASIGCMSSSSTTVDRSARHAVHAAKSARSGGIVTTPPVERIDLSGRTFDNFRHPRGDTAELILVRHGQTEANINGLLVGQQDVLLTDLGLRQAEATAEAVAAQAPDAIAVSPLQRARQTAAPIVAATRLYPTVVEEIAEFSFGELEGWAEQDAITAHPHLRPLDQRAQMRMGCDRVLLRPAFQLAETELRDLFDDGGIRARCSGLTAIASGACAATASAVASAWRRPRSVSSTSCWPTRRPLMFASVWPWRTRISSAVSP